MARKGFYEELLKAQELKELTGKMVAHANHVMNDESVDQARKDAMTHKILPKIIDKAIPTQLTGEEGNAIVIHVAREVAEAEKLYDTPQNASGDSQGSA